MITKIVLKLVKLLVVKQVNDSDKVKCYFALEFDVNKEVVDEIKYFSTLNPKLIPGVKSIFESAFSKHFTKDAMKNYMMNFKPVNEELAAPLPQHIG